MKAIRIHQHGGAELLRFEEIDPGLPGPKQARVRHTAIGVNFIDVYHRTGLYPLPSFPHGLGVEAVGIVEEVGEGVSEVKLGDRVAYVGGSPGAYAEARVVDTEKLVPLPASIDDETAAAVLLKGMTTEALIRRAYPVKSGETVLFHAAAGGVGTIATQWLAHLGATVIGTVGSDDKAALVRTQGVAHPIVYTREDFVAGVREITKGEGVPVVFDSVGKSTFAKSLECLRPRGMFVGFGNASGKPDPLDIATLAKSSLFLTRPVLFHYISTRAELLATSAALFDVVASGAVRIEIRHRWPLAEAAAAHRALEGRGTIGPILLIP